MHKVEVMEKLLDSQKNNDNPQQQAVYDLLRRTVNFAAQVRATPLQSFVAMEDQFRRAVDGWAVPSKANEIGTMAYGFDPGPKVKTQVYYIVCLQGSRTARWPWVNAASGMEIRRESRG
jgi:hypothetical protein